MTSLPPFLERHLVLLKSTVFIIFHLRPFEIELALRHVNFCLAEIKLCRLGLIIFSPHVLSQLECETLASLEFDLFVDCILLFLCRLLKSWDHSAWLDRDVDRLSLENFVCNQVVNSPDQCRLDFIHDCKPVERVMFGGRVRHVLFAVYRD
jgi:hypothetical protein